MDIVPHYYQSYHGFHGFGPEVWYNREATRYKLCTDSDDIECSTGKMPKVNVGLVGQQIMTMLSSHTADFTNGEGLLFPIPLLAYLGSANSEALGHLGYYGNAFVPTELLKCGGFVNAEAVANINLSSRVMQNHLWYLEE